MRAHAPEPVPPLHNPDTPVTEPPESRPDDPAQPDDPAHPPGPPVREPPAAPSVKEPPDSPLSGKKRL